MAYTLNQFGLEPTGDLTMIKAIQKEVKRLCNRDDIAVAIVNQDVEERFEENRQKFLTYDDEDDDDGKVCIILKIHSKMDLKRRVV